VSVPAEQIDTGLDELRVQVAAADREILAAINRRIEVVRQIRRHKQREGLSFVDAAQEERLMVALAEANGGPLSEAALRQLFGVVLALTKREVARLELRQT
jgi:chorismate mutase